nr:alpha/beta hydrolase [uncultured Gellertiella sp.]
MAPAADSWNRVKRAVVLQDGRLIRVIDTGGDRPALLLLHGYSDTSRSFAPLLGPLGGYRLIMPDLPGHGRSDPPPAQTLDGVANDIAALLAVLGVTPALVVGHSLGSMLALALAARQMPGLCGVVTLAGSACPALEGLAMLDPIRAFADPVDAGDPFFDLWYQGPMPVDPAFLGLVRQEAAAMPAAVWQLYLAILEDTDLRPGLAEIRVPCLAISGTGDSLFDSRHGDMLCAGLARAERRVLEGHGHNPHWESPARIARLIDVFARRCCQV